MTGKLLRDDLRLRRDGSIIRIRQVVGDVTSDFPDVDPGWRRTHAVASFRSDGTTLDTVVDELTTYPPEAD